MARPEAGEVWGDPSKPDTWAWFTKRDNEYMKMYMFLSGWEDVYSSEEAAIWATGNCYVNITELIKDEPNAAPLAQGSASSGSEGHRRRPADAEEAQGQEQAEG